MKKYEELIEVQVEASEGRARLDVPVSFRWRGRQYLVSRLMQYWREAAESWDPSRARQSEFFRVEAEGGTYDLRLERAKSEGAAGPGWRLSKVWD